MLTRTFDGVQHVKFGADDEAEFDAWVVSNGWDSVEAFQTETGYGFAGIRYRWFKIVEKRGRRYVSRKTHNLVRIQS